ncbi:MAG: hypothetical protein HY810_10055, partial [Candidatus Omnitrophica bacterium]|nr:hypothetical protein [Candidatus Omnitrophota bacterium]
KNAKYAYISRSKNIGFGANDIYIVKLSITGDRIYNRNVFGVNEQGEKIWKIEEPDSVEEDSPYTDILFENGELIICNFRGKDYVYDIDTGRRIKEAVF